MNSVSLEWTVAVEAIQPPRISYWTLFIRRMSSHQLSCTWPQLENINNPTLKRRSVVIVSYLVLCSRRTSFEAISFAAVTSNIFTHSFKWLLLLR